MTPPNPAVEYKKLAVTLGTYGSDTPACMSISHGTLKDAATISFERTLRVPDNQVVNNLPPSLGQFPLFSVADYQDRMPVDMAKKGGIFLPMYQREAMWIKFSAKEPFALKIYVGGVNAISGVPIKEKPEAMLKRLQLSDKAKQDYVVLPDQPWLDGIASDDGRIRQFVAMPKGSGYSVEAQVTGEEKIDGMQFELTPIKRGCPALLNVKVYEGAYRNNASPVKEKLLDLQEQGIGDMSTILDLKMMIEKELGVAVSDQRLTLVKPPHTGSTSEINSNRLTMGEVWIPESSIIEVFKHVPLVAVGRSRLGSACGKMRKTSVSADISGAECDDEYCDSEKSDYKMQSEFTVPGAALDDCKFGSAMNSYYGAVTPLSAPKATAMYCAAPVMLKESAMPIMAQSASITSGVMRKVQRRRSERAPGQTAPPPVQIKAMSLAAGGLIKQSISADCYPSYIWDAESTILFNVQLLNSESFIAVTGREPPTTPIDANTYQQYGYPFFDIWNEQLSGVKGDFNMVKSVGAMDENLAKTKKDAFWGNLSTGSKENGLEKKEIEFQRDEPLKFPVVMLDMSFTRTFKPLKEIEEEAARLKAAV